uniref:Membrane magnesium transporter n=1 Tax=Chlamydomonas leiostraca TaxID=1034604 RepID=A0A7S0WFD4_9CHLO|mmetsp:Transcript_12386/g.30410  ORF Transcript_12386/g.30410 Transcript_12386/m.30410 type:complete len:108 (+) Transcript_12386:73-396(+)
MRFSLGGLFTVLGFAALLHTTYGVIKHRALLKLLQEEFTTLPAALMMELAIASGLCVMGAFLLAGSLKVVMSSKQTISSDMGSMRMDFVAFGTRARCIPVEGVPPLS